MLLVIDAGNTNLVFALYDGEKQMGQWRCKTDHQRTADEYFVWLSQLVVLEGFRTTDITAVAVGSVVPAANFALRKLSEKSQEQDSWKLISIRAENNDKNMEASQVEQRLFQTDDEVLRAASESQIMSNPLKGSPNNKKFYSDRNIEVEKMDAMN